MAANYAPSFTYTDFAASLKYDLFNASEWAALFAASGARYTVHLTKHHDGFTLWPSNTSARWNAVDVGPRLDVVGAVTAAVKAAGLHAGLYHSLFEWNNPIYLADKATNFSSRNFVPKTMGELYDLVERYEPDLLWSDGDWEAPDAYWDAPSFLAWLANDSPVASSVVWNDRWGKGTTCVHGSFLTCSDRYSPGHVVAHKWENAMTLDAHSWGYRRNAAAGDYLSVAALLAQLASTVSCGGNLLVNVGPAADGSIPVPMQERLLALGAWLRVNGAAIYGTTPWRAQNETAASVWYTAAAPGAGADVFALLLSWPAGGALHLAEPVAGAAVRATLLTARGALACAVNATPGAAGLSVSLPPYEPDLAGTGTDVAWALRLEGVA